MNKYEIMFVVKNTIDESTVNKTVDELKSIITSMKSEIIDFKEMGQKQLAYEIKKEVSGFYFLITANATKEAVAEFDRIAKINENVIRHLVINLDKE